MTFSAISGIGASQHIDNLIKYREMGMTTDAVLQQASDHAAAVDELRTLPTIADLFTKPPPQVNQFLFRLFGDFRLQIADGEIVGMIRDS